jgi:hypothetical protein
LLRERWQLEDVGNVESLIASVVNAHLGRRRAYLRPDLRGDLDAYLLARTWELYQRFDPEKASTPLSLSTFLTRRPRFAVTDWFRLTFTHSRYRVRFKEVWSLDAEQELKLKVEDVPSCPRSLTAAVGDGSALGSFTRPATRSSTDFARFAPRVRARSGAGLSGRRGLSSSAPRHDIPNHERNDDDRSRDSDNGDRGGGEQHAVILALSFRDETRPRNAIDSWGREA